MRTASRKEAGGQRCRSRPCSLSRCGQATGSGQAMKPRPYLVTRSPILGLSNTLPASG